MKGLSNDIRMALDTVIEGFEYRLTEEDLQEAEKLKKILGAKVESFQVAKDIVKTWFSSPNAPSKDTVKHYLELLVEKGSIALEQLRGGLASEIDYEELSADKHTAAIQAKRFLLTSINDLSGGILELQEKLDVGDFAIKDREFKLGYPEKVAKYKLFPERKELYKDWENEEKEAVKICPNGSEGEIITISDLRIQLPAEPEDKTTIAYHDLPQDEQFWRRPEVPSVITPDNVDEWADFIKEEYRRRIYGYWFYNNGKATYVPGDFYFGLTHCMMFDTGGFMDFRIAQLRMSYHMTACVVDQRCLGQIFLKSRRTGFTYMVIFHLLNYATLNANKGIGMTSKTGDDAEEAFAKFSYAFRNLPFYFRPVVQGDEDSASELFFGKPKDRTKAAKKKRDTSTTDYLDTKIDWKTTKNGSYDSMKLNRYLGDECGKWLKPEDYIVHWSMVSPTMMPAGRVVGKAFLGSTMNPMEKGGSQMVEIYKSSDVTERNEVTQKTASALYKHFLPAQENMETYTDKFGFCHTTKPLKKTLNVHGEEIKIGSLDELLATEEAKRKQSDKALNEQQRTYPRTEELAMRDDAADSTFNVTNIYDHMEYNDNKVVQPVRGNFVWKNGVKDSEVIFVPDTVNGRFLVNWVPSAVDGTEGLKNNVAEKSGLWYPENKDIFGFGCDPFSLKSAHKGGSNGAMHGMTQMIVPEGVPRNSFIVEYIARPPDEYIFFEDVIKCIRFYGTPILVESNRIDLLRHMRNRGYRPFALNRVDRTWDRLNSNEREYGGQVMSSKDILDSHMNGLGSWIEQFVGSATEEVAKATGRELGSIEDTIPFNETLRDWLKFDPEKRTKHDATISGGLAVMACNTSKYKKAKKTKKKNLKGVVKKYKN